MSQPKPQFDVGDRVNFFGLKWIVMVQYKLGSDWFYHLNDRVNGDFLIKDLPEEHIREI